MVKWKSSLASNEVFRVRVLVGVLEKLDVWCLWCSGSARLAVNQKVAVRPRSDTL